MIFSVMIFGKKLKLRQFKILNRLHYTAQLHKWEKGMAVNSLCPAAEESLLHLLWDCIKDLWFW